MHVVGGRGFDVLGREVKIGPDVATIVGVMREGLPDSCDEVYMMVHVRGGDPMTPLQHDHARCVHGGLRGPGPPRLKVEPTVALRTE